MVAIRVMHEFFSHYYDYLDVLEVIDIIIMPVSNPDGYEFSRNEDRGWTKNRQLNVGSSCVGVSVYHNFEAGFYNTPDVSLKKHRSRLLVDHIFLLLFLAM